MGECPNCGGNIPQCLVFSEERDITFRDEGIETEVPCECGKMYTVVYSYTGIWDPEEEEYVTRA